VGGGVVHDVRDMNAAMINSESSDYALCTESASAESKTDSVKETNCKDPPKPMAGIAFG